MKKFWFFSLALILLSGCVPSLHPFYYSSDLIKDARLIGVWQGPKEGIDTSSTASIWEFTDTDHQHYQLRYTADQKQGKFEANLFTLGGQHYLDIFPRDQQEFNLLQSLTNFPGHLLCKVVFHEENISLQYIDSDHLETLFKQHRIRLRHLKNAEGKILLTADTQDLREFLLKYNQHESFFTEQEFLVKNVSAK